MIFRDDDISKFTDLTTIMKIQELFDRHKKIHTVTVLMEGLWESRGVWEWLMTTPNLNIALHGWKHINYDKLTVLQIVDDILGCLSYWKTNVERCGYKVESLKVFYPPWNSLSEHKASEVSTILGIKVDTRTRISSPTEIYDFHWWDHIGGRDLNKLEEALVK